MWARARVDKTSEDDFAHTVSSDVNVTREFPAYQILAHNNMTQFRQECPHTVEWLQLRTFNVRDGFVQIERCLASRDKSRPGGGKGHLVLVTSLPSERASVHY